MESRKKSVFRPRLKIIEGSASCLKKQTVSTVFLCIIALDDENFSHDPDKSFLINDFITDKIKIVYIDSSI
jgi:hypothetical protein